MKITSIGIGRLLRKATKRCLSGVFLLILGLYATVFNKRIAIIASLAGNLGNRLFLFSNLIGFAIENKLELMNPAFYDYAGCFETTRNDFFCRYPPRSSIFSKQGPRAGKFFLSLVSTAAAMVRRLPENRFVCVFALDSLENRINLDNENFIKKISGKKVMFFQGWLFLDQKNMVKYSHQIRRYFTPAETFRDSIDLPVKTLGKSCDVIFGLVIRRGAYKWWCDGKYFFSLDTYVQWMHEMRGCFPEKKVGFFICSDENLDEANFAGFTFVFRARHDLENRYSLAQCDYIVSAPSTYGGWAAFYGNVPMNILSSPQQHMSLVDFRRIENHTDLRDSALSTDIDVTERVSAF